jgi:uncharacterized membrane protein
MSTHSMNQYLGRFLGYDVTNFISCPDKLDNHIMYQCTSTND